jgi:antitoxin VapB
MALNLKNHEVELLAQEIAGITGENKTEVVRRALSERRERLAYRINAKDRRQELLSMLEREIWPLVPQEQRGKRLTREQEDEILGYGAGGV